MRDIPTAEELVTLRRGLRTCKPPHVVNGMWCSEPGIGGAKFIADNDDFIVQWVIFHGGVKSDLKTARWSDLCTDPAHERQRLELGWLISEYMEFDAQRVMDSIGHPTEAIREAAPIREMAEGWRSWAVGGV